MSDLSNEKILEIIKTKGNLEAVKYIKDKLKVDLKDARKLVDDVIAENPDVKPVKPNPVASAIATFILIAVVLVIYNKCSGEGSSHRLTHEERIEKLFSNWDGSQPAVVKWIKQHIKDPDSYKHIETKFIDKTDRLNVITKFTATNSFGGRVTTTCLALIDTQGNLLSAELIE